MVRTPRPVALLALAFATVLLVAGCGDDDGDAADDGTTVPPTEAPDETPPADDPDPTDEPTEPAGDATVAVASTGLGDVLVDAEGFTLYLFTNDEPGVSNCDATCVAAWPPLTVDDDPAAGEGVTATLGTITRDDGTTQVTAGDVPLYRWASDTAPGDTTGQGVGGVWFAVNPDGIAIEG